MKNKLWISPGNNGGFRENNISDEEALEAFNTLVGWCVGLGLKPGHYSNIGLIIRVAYYLLKLRK